MKQAALPTYNAFKDGGYKEAISAAVDCIPILGNAKAAYETIVGKDPITGRKLEPWERVVSGASVFGGPAVKIAKRVGGIAVGGKQAGGAISGIIAGGKKGNTTPKPKDKTHKSTVKTDYDKMKDRIQERYKKFAEDKKQNIPQTSDKLLPNELNHGHFGKLPNKKGDDITGHHMPSNKYMQEEFGIDTKESYAMFLEHPHPGKGGRHRRTFTYGLNQKSRKEDFDLYMSLKPRDALAFDINDARRILKEDGLYNKENKAKLKEYIDYYEEYERKNMKIFEKQKE
ncbi:pre-toxin TG domain-containing protein [Lysinibacillus xylanilyticus]|uniref:pre-toxin TG domain-containing protein n=1 Tax=Lysinibacillus xylanilyticus TaxID=582475 RepID=UPI00381B21A7